MWPRLHCILCGVSDRWLCKAACFCQLQQLPLVGKPTAAATAAPVAVAAALPAAPALDAAAASRAGVAAVPTVAVVGDLWQQQQFRQNNKQH